jgi:hypothetical protein
VSPGLHHVQNNAGASQQASRAKKRRAQRIRAAAWRADTVGRLPVRVHRSVPLRFSTDGDFVIIEVARDEQPSSPGVFNAIPAGMETDDTEARFRRLERQWHRQMVLDNPVDQDALPDLQNP